MPTSALDKYPVRRLRGAGGVESGEAAAGLPVLRHGGAVHGRRGDRCRSSSSISPRRCASCPTKRAAGWPRSARSSARAARRCRSSIPSASGRTATSAARRRSSTTPRSRRRSGPQSLLPFKVTEAQVREQIRTLVREQVAGAERAQEPGARRSRARRLHPVLDVRRARRLPVGGRGRALLLHDRNLPGQRPHADAAGAARALGAGVRRGPALLRRRAGAGHAGRVARRC